MNLERIRGASESEFLHPGDRGRINIYIGSLSEDSSAAALLRVFQNAVDRSGLQAKVIKTGSFGCYDLEPIVVVDPPDLSTVLYNNMTPDTAKALIQDLLVKRIPRKTGALCCLGDKGLEDIPHISEIPLFSLQHRITLRNCGWIDPENIHHYIVHKQGYRGLSQALQMERRELLHVRVESAIRGRSTACDSTIDKWRLVGESEEADKFLICKAIDAGCKAHTARLLTEGDPHSILEGMLISTYAIDASHCLIYVRENTESARRLKRALEQMRRYGLVGANILDSVFSAEIEIKEISASYVSGYETELFRCVEERQPLPHVYPTYPAVDQFAGKPAVIACPEAMSNLSAFLPDDFEKDKGSKVVTLSGNVTHNYTVEVAFGTTIREIVNNFGGGTSNGKAIKTIQVGGPAGRFIAPDSFNTRLDWENAPDSISNLDSGTIEVFDADSSIVEAVKDIMFCAQTQSCGKCVFCREGCLQMLSMLEDLCENKGSSQDLDLMTELGNDMKTACLCAFGRTVPDAVLSSIRLFRVEYEERIKGSTLSGKSSSRKL
jgi:NADH-quinone oxidoreductase subunit F